VVTVVIDMMGFGMVMPVLPFLLSDLTGKSVEDVAVYGGALTALYAVMNLLAGPTLGGLSDRYGRRPVLLVSLAMLGIDFLVMGFAHSLWVLVIGRALSGVFAATHSTAFSYIADVTEPEERGKAFGLVGAAFGVGFIVGPAVGGLLGQIDPRAPFFAAAGLAFLNVAYGLFVLPESLPRENRRAFDWRRANPLGAARHFSKLPRVAWFLVALAFFTFGQWVYPATWSYHSAVRYGWDTGQIGWSLALVGVGAALVQGGLVGWLIKRVGPSRAALTGLGFSTAGYLLYSVAGQPWMVFAIVPVSALAGFFLPAINAMMSAEVARDAQGELHGAAGSLQSLVQIVSVVAMTQVFQAFNAKDAAVSLPGAAFLLAALMNAVCLVFFVIGMRRRARAG
jgi:DHA1 family tetracycline resistance protein-like MFS transporter